MDDLTIYSEGRPVGRLRQRQEGLYTVLEAVLPPGDGLTRLWVFGGGRRACLGVMEPRREGRFFRRRYSRAELAALPAPLAYAATEPEPLREARGTQAPGPLLLTLEGRRYLALPCAELPPRPGLRRLRLKGRDYLLFRW